MSELELWNELGNVYYKTGAINEAIRTYQKVIELNPGCGQSYNILASILVSQGRHAEAIPVIKKGIELMDNAINQAFLWNQLGDTYRKLEDYINSRASYRKAIELDPEDTAYQKNLAEVEPVLPVEENFPAVSEPSPTILGSRSLDTEDGILPIDPPEVVKSIDASTDSLLRLGILHWRNGEYERAIEFLKIALDAAERSQNPFKEALSYYAIAKVETNLGKIEDAIQAYQSAANLAPDRIFPWNNLGDLNCMLNRYDDAQAAFKEAIEHNPKDTISWNGMGDVYHKLGRNEDAIAAYQLGNVFEKQSIEEDAFTEFEKAIEADQENPQVWNEAGNIYFDIGAYEDAICSYHKAFELDPSNATYQAGLAKAEKALEEVRSRSEARSQETVSEVAPETLRHSEGSVVETTSQETDSHPANGVIDPEPEAAFWVFESVSADSSAQQPARQYLPAMAEKIVGGAKPTPALALPTRHAQTFSRDQVLTDAIHDHANILVQLTPHPVQPARTEEIISYPDAKHGRESASADADSGLQKPTNIAADFTGGDSALQAVQIEDQPADQPAKDFEVLDHDIAAYRKVTEINPKNDRAWDTLGNMYETCGLHRQAVTAFEQAIANAPQKEVYYYHLGIALGYQMQYAKAIEALERVVALNPRYMLAHCALAGYYRRLGKEAEAQEHMQIARPSMEEENEYNQACFESIGGNADRAIKLLESALEKQQVQPGMVLSDPDLDFIRKDPRFEELLTKNKILR